MRFVTFNRRRRKTLAVHYVHWTLCVSTEILLALVANSKLLK